MRTEMHSFDTHAHVKALIKAGLEEPQAEAIIKTLVNSREYDFSKLATKEQVVILERAIAMIQQDIEKAQQEIGKLATKEELKAEIKHLEEKLNNKIEAVVSNSQNSLLKWIVPIFISNVIAILGIVLTVIKVFGFGQH